MSAQANPTDVLENTTQTQALPLRVAVICDFLEEDWPSMDLVGNMLFDQLQYCDSASPQRIRPGMKFRGPKPHKSARLYARFVQYPRALRKIAADFDLFHIVDHSYAHLVHELPSGRAVVTCHDLDTFRCLLDPDREPRSFAFRSMTRRILSGLQAAAHVTCDTAATRDAIIRHGLLSQDKLTVVHNGVHPELSPHPDAAADKEIAQRLGRKPGSCLELLHVGSTIARKRIDVLLHVFAEVRKARPGARLLRVGSRLTPQQQSLATVLGVYEHIDFLERLDVHLLAACYRRADVLLQPSEAEGFGLPVIEGLACGTPVVTSDIPALREVGGDAAVYCGVANISSWTAAVLSVLAADDATRTVTRLCALQQASQFTWDSYGRKMLEIYRQVLPQ